MVGFQLRLLPSRSVFVSAPLTDAENIFQLVRFTFPGASSCFLLIVEGHRLWRARKLTPTDPDQLKLHSRALEIKDGCCCLAQFDLVNSCETLAAQILKSPQKTAGTQKFSNLIFSMLTSLSRSEGRRLALAAQGLNQARSRRATRETVRRLGFCRLIVSTSCAPPITWCRSRASGPTTARHSTDRFIAAASLRSTRYTNSRSSRQRPGRCSDIAARPTGCGLGDFARVLEERAGYGRRRSRGGGRPPISILMARRRERSRPPGYCRRLIR